MKLTPIPSYCDLIPLKEFVEIVRCGSFVDSDGSGYYATDQNVTDIPAVPSEIKDGTILHEYPFIAWFNK